VYTLGLAFGPVISAPLSERFGRKLVYLLSAPIFMLFTLGAGFSKTFGSLLVCRLFAGLTGSPALAVGEYYRIALPYELDADASSIVFRRVVSSTLTKGFRCGHHRRSLPPSKSSESYNGLYYGAIRGPSTWVNLSFLFAHGSSSLTDIDQSLEALQRNTRAGDGRNGAYFSLLSLCSSVPYP
jgi:MFS family permease